jgi:hypothetical protein
VTTSRHASLLRKFFTVLNIVGDNTNNGAGLVKVYIPKVTPFYPLLTPFFGAVFVAPLFHQF